MNSFKAQRPVKVIIVSDSHIMVADAVKHTLETNQNYLSHASIDDTLLGIPAARETHLRADLCAPTLLQEIRPGSDGWTELYRLAMAEYVNQRVTEAVGEAVKLLFSDAGRSIERAALRGASALSSLDVAEGKAMKASRKRSGRAKKRISSSARGYAKSPRKPPSKKAAKPAPKRKTSLPRRPVTSADKRAMRGSKK